MPTQDRKKYDFASVGKTTVKARSSYVSSKIDMPIGIRTPIQFGYDAGETFKMSTNIVSQVRDNFRNMLATNWGERLMLNDFGASLEELAFELGTETADFEAIARIRATIEKYMPFITPLSFESFNTPSETNVGLANIGIRITYSIDGISDPSEIVDEVIIYTAA